MARLTSYGMIDSKYLPRRTASDKVLRDKAFNIAKNLKYYEYQHRLASLVYQFFDIKSTSFADKSANINYVKSIFTSRITQTNY